MTNNPYLTIWFNPKRTIDNILTGRTKFTFYIPILFIVFSAVLSYLDDVMEFGLAFSIIMLIIAIVLGYFTIGQLTPWLVLKTGKIWKGKSGFPELQIIFGLAQIPVLLILAQQIVSLALGDVKPIWQTNIAIQWIVWIFQMRIIIIGIAKAQGFSYTISLLNVIISGLPFFIIQLMIL